MRVLFLTPHYPPDVAATGQLIEELVEETVQAGHEAVVITARPSYQTHNGAPFDPRVVTERRAGAELKFLPVPRVGRRGVWARLVPFGSYFLGSAVLAPLVGRVDVVYAMSTPPLLSGLVATALQALRGVPFVYNLQDVYPDVAEALGVLRGGPVSLASGRVESFLRRRARVVTVLAEDMRERVLARGAAPRALEIIPNWIDTEIVKPLPRKSNPFLAEHDLGGKFVVLYSGNLGRAHGAEVLPEVAARLADLDDVILLIVGEGPASG